MHHSYQRLNWDTVVEVISIRTLHTHSKHITTITHINIFQYGKLMQTAILVLTDFWCSKVKASDVKHSNFSKGWHPQTAKAKYHKLETVVPSHQTICLIGDAAKLTEALCLSGSPESLQEGMKIKHTSQNYKMRLELITCQEEC